ncbi:DUF3949 domain-containing protein [Bacillus timonensis]|uniref:DUF3949 domain-containing protein n=1 Tax=Bacillus timonensis TaxID=1033734 RepID=UPI0003175874|nr:DUF3949 domain-containing protein [Bacillus timonensis]
MMEDSFIFYVIGGVLLLYIVIMIPIQYRNIVATKEEIKKSKKTHNEMYEKMSFEEQQLQFNLQGSLLNLPSTLIATLIYKIRHRNK